MPKFDDPERDGRLPVAWARSSVRGLQRKVLVWLFSLTFTFVSAYRIYATRPDLEQIRLVEENRSYIPITMVILFGGLTGFLYFLVQWGLQRIPTEKDLRSPSQDINHGNPLIIAWIIIVGSGLTCFIGANVYTGTYLRLLPSFQYKHIGLLAILVPLFLNYAFLMDVVFWYMQNRKAIEVDPATVETSDLWDYKSILMCSIPAFISYALVAVSEEHPFRMILLLLGLLFEAFAVGAYAAFFTDFLPRAKRASMGNPKGS